MATAAGVYKLGPDTATLSVRTKKAGAASMAGHNLLIEVSDWSGTLELAADPAQSRIELRADSGSLKVLEGSGGAMTLEDEHKASIEQTIDDEILKRSPIVFRSDSVRPSTSDLTRFAVAGELELAGQRGPIEFELALAPDGTLSGSAIVKQTSFGIKPYSALFGTLKVIDEVTVEIAAKVPPS
jgi:polyisoprenoid-binding protein YceI